LSGGLSRRLSSRLVGLRWWSIWRRRWWKVGLIGLRRRIRDGRRERLY